jgi:hypothetical protein
MCLQNAVSAGGVTEVRYPVNNAVLTARKRSAEAAVADDGVPLMKSECLESAAV